MKLTSIEIINKLRQAGHQAYWAGGCVRDILLGIKPKDYDIVTSAHPDQIEQLLNKTVPIGKQFGVILAVEGEHSFEVATFRSDSGYSDGRRPDAVEFKTAREDACRRDFTINGLFYDPITDEILDYIEGQKDLDAKLVRFIGDPETRILEDHLRLIRAVRFKNVYDFQYEPKTYQSIKKHAALISKISGERIREELNKMLQDKNRVKAINDLEDLGLLLHILPEVQAMKGVAQPAEYHGGRDVFEHTMLCLESLPEDAPLSLIWSTLLHDSGKPATFEVTDERITFYGHAEKSAEIAKSLLGRLNFPRNFINQVAWLCANHMSLVPILDMPKAAKVRWFLKPYFLELLELNKADASGIPPVDLSLYNQLLEIYRYEMSLKPDQLPKLLTGTEIMQITGLPAGPKIKQIVDELFNQQVEGNITTQEEAREWASRLKV